MARLLLLLVAPRGWALLLRYNWHKQVPRGSSPAVEARQKVSRLHARLKRTRVCQFIDKAAAKLPFGRLIEPAEVAKAVLWMVSEDSGLMTGSVIQFDQSVWGAYEDTPTPSSEMTYA